MEMWHLEIMKSVKVVPFCLLIILSQMTGCYCQCSNNQIEVGFNETVTKCCDTCKPGNGVSIQCSPSENTQCQKCIPGKTYSDRNSFEEPCKQCSTCGNKTHFILHPCNETQNTICGCPDGSYYDADTDQCKFCYLCHPGKGAVRRCSSRNNTICEPCANGTYSNKLDPYSGCTPCTKCSETEVALKECSATEDRICFSMHAGEVKPPVNSSTPTVYTHDDDDDGDVIPVYCSVLGLVVVGLLGYVVIKHWRRIRAKRRHKAPCSHEDVEYSKASGGDSGIFVENESPKNYTYCLTSRVRDLPMSKRKELEKVLSYPQSDSWKSLAKELGYSNKRMTQFESKKKNDTNSGFNHMLHDWERRDLAIVSHLIQCLRNIGREDGARILYIDSTEGRTQIMAKQQQNHVV